VQSRVLQTAISDLLECLPMLGLLVETYELTKTALAMERNQRIGSGAVTEFDELFKVAYTSMVKCLIQATERLHQGWCRQPAGSPKQIAVEINNVLFECVEMLTQSMLILWLDHSHSLRLSVLEKVLDRRAWLRLVEFIQRFGQGLFTQEYLHLANIRSILHQGVETWLEQIRQSAVYSELAIIQQLDSALPRQKAVRNLTMVLEAVGENYNEYRDYNTTTTQSDRGELLFILLDFLRLRSRYERDCWNLKPAIWAHEIMVRDQQNGVARMWRRSLTECVAKKAAKYLEKLDALRQKYSVQMSSIGRRLEERFVMPMQVDRLTALVGPAMTNPSTKESQRVFELLQHEALAFSRSTMGVGLDLPAWLGSLEQAVRQYHLPERLQQKNGCGQLIQPLPVAIADLREQLESLPRRAD
jgi:hypothetical protein